VKKVITVAPQDHWLLHDRCHYLLLLVGWRDPFWTIHYTLHRWKAADKMDRCQHDVSR